MFASRYPTFIRLRRLAFFDGSTDTLNWLAPPVASAGESSS
jgi:hypothetical protein